MSDSAEKRATVWYVRNPVDGIIEEYYSEAEARNRAHALLQNYEEEAASEGWPNDIDCLEWGLLSPLESAKVDVLPPSDTSGNYETWDVRLVKSKRIR